MSDRDLSSWVHTKTLAGHMDSVGFLAMTPDERLVATASRDDTARVWDRERAECVRSWTDPEGLYSARLLDGGGIVAASNSDTCTLWSVSSGETLATVEGSRLQTACAARGSILAIGNALGSISLIDAKTLAIRDQPRALQGAVESLAFSDDERVLMAAGDGKVARIEPVDGAPRWSASGHDPKILISQLLVHGAREFVVSCSYDGTARAWHLDTGDPIGVLRHTGGVVGGAISPDGRYVFTHGTRNFLWDTATWSLKGAFAGGEGYLSRVRFASDGGTVFAAGQDGRVRIWEVPTGRSLEVFGPGSKRLLDMLLCEKSGELVLCGDDPRCSIWKRNR